MSISNECYEYFDSDNHVSGGIRGIAELETLRQIERAMGDGMPLTCFFDLIVGTRYGCIIPFM